MICCSKKSFEKLISLSCIKRLLRKKDRKMTFNIGKERGRQQRLIRLELRQRSCFCSERNTATLKTIDELSIAFFLSLSKLRTCFRCSIRGTGSDEWVHLQVHYRQDLDIRFLWITSFNENEKRGWNERNNERR